MLAILFLLAVGSLVSGTVYVNAPLDGQLPLIARPGDSYSWTMSSKTFSTNLDQILIYSATGLPAWLSFDNVTLTFHGTPAAADEGTPQIAVTADDAESAASSTFILCVTHYPAPTLQKTLSQQFYAGNPSLSSVFLLAPGSALASDDPTLRVPSKWSFSIGLDSDTYTAPNDLYYDALLSDGTVLPEWIKFDASTVTFDGVAPSDQKIPTPLTLEIEVHASDQEGYSAGYVPFNLVVATHELCALSSLPTVNLTAGAPFNVTMSSAADFTGVLLDGQPIQPANVSELSVDVSSYRNWLKYDAESKALYGAPPDNFTAADGKPELPVTLMSNINQTLYISVALDIVPSYFSESDLGTINADPGQQVQFDLTKFFANPPPQPSTNLSATFNPEGANDYLTFNPATAQLTGKIPTNSDVAKVEVTFVAYSRVTHSTSHATLLVLSPELEKVDGNGTSGMAAPSKSRVTLIVSLVFGIIGGLFFLGFALALFRRYARVKDSAVLGEEGTRAWTDEEKRWYGIGIEVRDGRNHSRAYGWNKEADTSATSEKGSLETQAKSSFDPNFYPQNSAYENLGLGLRRVSPHGPTTPSTVQASCAEGVMKKAEFLGKIRNAARNVSDKYKRRSPPSRPIISNPVPLASRHQQVEGLPIEGQYVEIVRSPPNIGSTTSSIHDGRLAKRASTLASFTSSPSNSTGERSIPRRRADFAPPRSPKAPRVPVPVVVKDSTRRSLVRESNQSVSGVSADSHSDTLHPGEDRPRLKQFTHSSRVPPPRSPSSNVVEPEVSPGARRVASQTAQVYKEGQQGRHTSIDELRMGMHYVHTLGEGSSNVRSVSDKSFSSLESSQHGHGTAQSSKEDATSRFLVRTGEKFKFRVPMQHSSSQYRKLEARLVSGRALPSFMHAELKGFEGKGDDKKAVEFYGVPAEGDIGELNVGVFNVEGGGCLARVTVEVVARNKRSPPLAE
ncbi:hypothetical protein PAXRUDRAFT_827439 [Paxillus rubicundulus Ve08.2h10]|uniref:Unplaced genomic scaffold scaffold_249, whole genome shotgun sequence n=1 Tax=Paxillus rubicundulus Ve08.2h10 TaxID=930991 RepID=A0A0D0E8K0_9AGAM|nr:hypothetical protein PAXRUDRAFT_827439 [Paxillus rubicundulus Ve08.2h10]